MCDQHGRSLLELLVTLAVMAVLSLVGLPSLSATLADAHRTSTVNTLVLGVQWARSETAKRAIPMTLCASRDGSHCTGSADWAAGWLQSAPIAHDPNPLPAAVSRTLSASRL